MSEPKEGTVIDAPELNEEYGDGVEMVWRKGRWTLDAYNQGGYDCASVDLEALRQFCLKHGIWKEAEVIRCTR